MNQETTSEEEGSKVITEHSQEKVIEEPALTNVSNGEEDAHLIEE